MEELWFSCPHWRLSKLLLSLVADLDILDLCSKCYIHHAYQYLVAPSSTGAVFQDLNGCLKPCMGQNTIYTMCFFLL